jgi:uncharacterized protein YjbJ (UPF0337 family)
MMEQLRTANLEPDGFIADAIASRAIGDLSYLRCDRPRLEKHKNRSELNLSGRQTLERQAQLRWSPAMGSMTDKIRGYFNQGAGKAKQNAGKAVGNDRLRTKGMAQEAKGDIQESVGKAKGAVKDAADRIDEKAHRKL